MKFTVDRQQMSDAVKKAARALPKLSPMPELSGILIRADADRGTVTVTCTDTATQIQSRLVGVHIEDGGSIVLDRILLSMLNLLPGDTVTFETGNLSNHLVSVRSGSVLYELPVIEAKNYPEVKVPFPEEFICIQNIGELVKSTAFAAETNGSTAGTRSLQNVKLSFSPTGVTAQAMNANFGAFAKSDHGSDGSVSLIVHQKALGILSGLISPKDVLYVGISGKIAVFMKEDLVFYTLLYYGDYHKSMRLMDRINPVYFASADAGELLRLADGITSIFMPEDDKAINLCFTADRVVMRGLTATGKSLSSIEAKDVIVTPESGFYYHAKHLIDCIRHTSGEIRLAVDPKGFLMLESGENRYFMSPRNPTGIKIKKKEEKPKTTKSKKAKEPIAA